ncbi:DUF736 domain-containing protein [Bradyrhizobium sp. sBnM-33]|uniref:DUF736 domain-containing protein n=1 Tax=Bradyrhizobium sp. sBnM-33 TaxID=2831780 RepID=UPI0020C09DA0|nr:DUF736 domain-containing protein [Bradyrhizobium sp. sBnM-33]WOH52407.1 DUF736 domain-containing protein [Bradyrhizobium sp. sBnM-33]
MIGGRQVLLPMQHSATLVKLIFWMVSIHAAYQFLAQDKKVAPWTPSTAAGPLRCESTASGLSPAIEAPMGAARESENKDTIMATIGTFTLNGNGFSGSIRTSLSIPRPSWSASRTL